MSVPRKRHETPDGGRGVSSMKEIVPAEFLYD
jgi:hypothetical protein